MSMISELVSELRSESDKCHARRNLLYVAASVIEELSAKLANANKENSEQYYNDGWIPCSERLPENNGWYLVTNELGVVQQQDWCALHWGKLRDDAVLAWQPLPQPYVKGE